jgi:hypothetical protein
MGLGSEYGFDKVDAILSRVLKYGRWNATELLVSVLNIIRDLYPF